jgi:hypothetical protein
MVLRRHVGPHDAVVLERLDKGVSRLVDLRLAHAVDVGEFAQYLQATVKNARRSGRCILI